MFPTGVSSTSRCPGFWCPILTMELIVSLLTLPAAQGVSLRYERETDEFYMNGQIRCRRCPSGSYVEAPCTTPNSIGLCMPCEYGSTYSEGPTGLDHCHSCTKCREDQEEVSPCTRTKNAVCHCKKGKYCPPNLPCEMCRTCTPSCPPEMVLKLPCNSTADILCAPHSSDHSPKIIIVCVATSLSVLIMLGVICICKKADISTFFKHGKSWFTESNHSGQDDTQVPLNSIAEPPIKLDFKEGTKREEIENIMVRAFYSFVELVPGDNWLKYMRRLALNENKIQEAKCSHPLYITEQCHTMLLLWHRSKNGSINHLLDTLRSMRLEKCANDIAHKLLDDGLFVQVLDSS